MNVKDFIEGYNSANNKEKYLAGHITNKYVSYATKIDECKRIIEITSYKEVNGKKIYWKNTPGQQFNFKTKLISYYTDIEFEPDDVVSQYDLLNELGLIENINDFIPESELIEWGNMLNICINDEYENTRSLVSYLDIKLESLNELSNILSNSLNTALSESENNVK